MLLVSLHVCEHTSVYALSLASAEGGIMTVGVSRLSDVPLIVPSLTLATVHQVGARMSVRHGGDGERLEVVIIDTCGELWFERGVSYCAGAGIP
jgi:hypothetical protein